MTYSHGPRRKLATLDLYGGEFLAESPYEEFAAGERERLRDLFVRASARLSGFCAAARQWSECIPICRRALSEDPYNEELHYHLIRAQVLLGHRKEALESYDRFEARITGELSLAPSARMRGLAEQIRAGRRALPGDRARSTPRVPRPSRARARDTNRLG